MTNRIKALLGSKYPRFILRVLLAVVSFAIAIVLMFIPGPAILFWILGFVLLGFSVGQILFSFKKVQDWLYAHIPVLQRLPRMRESHMRMIMRNSWVQWVDRMNANRERRQQKRDARRAAKREAKLARRRRVGSHLAP